MVYINPQKYLDRQAFKNGTPQLEALDSRLLHDQRETLVDFPHQGSSHRYVCRKMVRRVFVVVVARSEWINCSKSTVAPAQCRDILIHQYTILSPTFKCALTSLRRRLAEQQLLYQQAAAIVRWARRARQRLRIRPGRWR